MNINLNQKELEIIDEALQCWEKQPNSDAFSGALLGSIFKSMARKEGETFDSKDDSARQQIDAAEKICKSRKNQSLLLRAKIMQASALQSEHEVAVIP